MFSTKQFTAVAAAAIALISADAALAGTMVVRSTGPSAGAYPVGKSLTASASIPLKAGDVVTVLDAGGTRILRGPGTVAVSGSGAASGSGFGALLANAGARQSRTGATRSAIGGGPARSPNVWYIDASKNGLHCVVDPASVSLWRPDSANEASLTVTRLSDGKVATLDFRAGQAVRQWPVEDMAMTEGAQFRITDPAAKAPITFKATLLGTAGDGIEGAAAGLMQKGCANQMDVLVEGAHQDGQIAVN